MINHSELKHYKLMLSNLQVLFNCLAVQLIEFDFFRKNIGRNVDGPPQSATTLVIIQDGIETRSVSVEEIFIFQRIKVAVTLFPTSQQGVRESFDRRELGFEAQTTDVDGDAFV